MPGPDDLLGDERLFHVVRGNTCLQLNPGAVYWIHYFVHLVESYLTLSETEALALRIMLGHTHNYMVLTGQDWAHSMPTRSEDTIRGMIKMKEVDE